MSPSPTDLPVVHTSGGDVLAFPVAAAPAHSVPVRVEVPDFVDLDAVLADVAVDGISAPPAEVAGLEAVVARAETEGIELHVVVLQESAPLDSQLRDLATTVGASDSGTVLVLGPGQVGTFSDSIDRVTLEAGQDAAYTSDAVVSANNFLDVVTEPGPSWTGLTIALILVVAGVLGATAWANARRFASSSEASTAPAQGVVTRDGDHSADHQ